MKVCIFHKELKEVEKLSPCRGICKICLKKTVHGYSTIKKQTITSFGYQYLIPRICTECSNKSEECIWC
jgi:hypothetical protein